METRLETFQSTLHRNRVREERTATVMLLLWLVGVFAVVIIPDSYAVKVIGVFASWLVLLVLFYHYSPDACFHRAWRRAVREVDRG